MRTWSLYAVIRLSGVVALAACAVAVTLARLEPTPARYRMGVPPHYGVINGFVLDPGPTRPGLLNAESGELSRFNVPAGERFDFGACSPWQNEEGEFQVVGRWSRNTPGCDDEELGCGIARYALPGGRVLDRVPLDVVPASRICWFPGMTARVLYAGTDGRLYTFAFEGPRAANADEGEAPAATAVAWRCPAPGTRPFVRDPVWPTDPRLGGRLVVSLSYRVNDRDDRLCAPRLWWVRLSGDGRAVVDAGPLDDPDARDDGTEHRYPNLTAAPDGRLTLAYLRHGPKAWLWDLRLTAVVVDPATGIPSIQAGSGRTVATDHLSSVAPFSADGRHVYGLLHDGRPGRLAKIVRYPTDPPARADAGALKGAGAAG